MYQRGLCMRGGLAALVSLAIAGQASAQGAGCYTAPKPAKLTEAEQRTVVINDQKVLRESGADFSLGRTLKAIIASAPGMHDPEAKHVDLLASMIGSFAINERTNPLNGIPQKLTERPGELGLDPVNLLKPTDRDGMRVVGLFNRLDLAPDNLKYCGEHRIVYAMGNPRGQLHRFTLIFEAALGNPDPNDPREGCRKVAAFWDGLQTKTGKDLAKALEDFYYVKGVGSGPVIHYTNLGLPSGQVRGNLFITLSDDQKHPWQLREWRITLASDGAPVFVADTVKSNPMPTLYGPKVGGEDARLDGLRAEFGLEFISSVVGEMVRLDVAALGNSAVPGERLIADMGADFPPKHNAFESQAQNTPSPGRVHVPARTDDPLEHAKKGGDLLARTGAKLTELKLASCNLTPEHVLARAGALSCGGCHDFSGPNVVFSRPQGQEIAPGVRWPAAVLEGGGFVHIDEASNLSPALKEFFLPARRRAMVELLKPVPPAPAPASAVAAKQDVDSVRDNLTQVQAAKGRPEAVQKLQDLESSVNTARQRDRKTPGFFVPQRRVH